MRTLDQLLAIRGRPSQPLVTYYDMATGERVELSTTTTANWVAKTSNFLVDDLDAEPGHPHPHRAAEPLADARSGSCRRGTSARPSSTTAADIGVSGPDLVADEPVRVAASLRPLGGRFAGRRRPASSTWAPRCRATATTSSPSTRRTPSTLALDLDGTALTHAELLAAAAPDGARRLVDARRHPARRRADRRRVPRRRLPGDRVIRHTGADLTRERTGGRRARVGRSITLNDASTAARQARPESSEQ